ncbi:MAG TPA: transposase domain-containing protein [Polyangiaceae bacterium]|nr:transposase domain-containing protein [Polyangiaceae bacterium]
MEERCGCSPVATTTPRAPDNLFTLIASARLHGLDPEVYLRDLFRGLAHWPKDRYLELAPKFWSATRARLDLVALALEIGPLAIPPPLSEEQTASS